MRRSLAFYQRHERYAPALFFFGGVAWDALTLHRIDAWVDNVLLLAYLIAAGGLILLATLTAYGCTQRSVWQRYAAWYPAGIQFFLGALFSAYVVFYFQSASLTPSSAFLVLLVGLLVGNEFIHRRLVSLYLLLALYFLACFSFFVFFVPVVTKTMNYGTFLGAGLLSVFVVMTMLGYLGWRGVFAEQRQGLLAGGLVLVLFGLVNLFYVQNWMPPVPLALRHGGIYHHVERTAEGYHLQAERRPWYVVPGIHDRVMHHVPGTPLYAFTAVFAPTDLAKGIVHEWATYDSDERIWATTDHIPFEIVGGRDDGYRGYTFKRNVRPGLWRVDVKTEEGLLLGRIRFKVEAVATEAAPVLRERVYR